MSGLIDEIQRDALDNKIPIESLLRRVKLAAAKLRLDTIEAWVEQELAGYAGEVPKYRKAHGQAAAWNPYHGWLPVHVADKRISDLISEARIAQSISSLRDLVDKESGNGTLHLPIQTDLVVKLNEIMNFQTARKVWSVKLAQK